METGADGYIIKPFSSEELLDTVGKFVKASD
jgi:DNA-binding response OmpR family regulator